MWFQDSDWTHRWIIEIADGARRFWAGDRGWVSSARDALGFGTLEEIEAYIESRNWPCSVQPRETYSLTPSEGRTPTP